MCTLRGLWILKEINSNQSDIIFSKRINTVEVRVRAISGTNYTPIPNDSDLTNIFNHEILNSDQYNQLKQQQQQQQQLKSSTSILNNNININSNTSNNLPPVSIHSSTPNTHIVSLNQDKLWPFVYIKKKSFYYLTIPVIEEFLIYNKKPSLIDLPAITASLNFLEDISLFCNSYLVKPGPYPELQIFLANIIPFGQPTDTNFNNIKSMIKVGFPQVETINQKRPVWKPYLHKGKQQLDFTITETVSTILYDNPNIQDVFKVSGALYCRADLEGMPEVSFYFNPLESPVQQQQQQQGGSTGNYANITSPTTTPTITHLSIDPSVQATSDININNKISFNPPLDYFKLLGYGVSGVSSIPLRGFYQMKETSINSVKILIQLKLNKDMNNSFEHCLVKIPFKNRGTIVFVNASPTTGTVHIDPTLKALVWNIGTKFTGRNLEVALPAEITFSTNHPPQAPTLIMSGSSGTQTLTGFPNQSFAIIDQAPQDEFLANDPFCVGPNSFIRIYFKILDCTTSTLNIDPKKVVIYPANKFKLNIERAVISNEYFIWNSLGNSKKAYQPDLHLNSKLIE
ncbi:hypothetical protein CYY_009904 [Polysphondylium violaceum]|uniref:MHD domain-containing protein n=1 Tax=Polysphondylium violaceum TaxID=133409 RepID=A0A8J4UVL1_9MYCE|nr:hypothetical protein CYY_009904 [Polysphondylium violaceum]